MSRPVRKFTKMSHVPRFLPRGLKESAISPLLPEVELNVETFIITAVARP